MYSICTVNIRAVQNLQQLIDCTVLTNPAKKIQSAKLTDLGQLTDFIQPKSFFLSFNPLSSYRVYHGFNTAVLICKPFKTL